MPKINVYLADELAAAVKELDLPVSSICQQALEGAVAQLRETKEKRAKSILTLFTDAARQAVALAEDEARALNHATIGTEHLLLGLLKAFGLNNMLPALEVTRDDIRRAVMGLMEPGETPLDGKPVFSARAKYALETSFREALRMGTKQVQPQHLLLGLARDEDSAAAKALARLDIDYARVRTAVLATSVSVVIEAAKATAARAGRRALQTREVKITERDPGGSTAGITSLIEMQALELKDAINDQIEELTRERDNERARNLALWEKLREHGIEPEDPEPEAGR